MNLLSRISKACAVSAIVFSTLSANASVIIGSADSGNCYPFSCAASDGITKYQQIYDGSLFNGGKTISAVKFFQWQPGMMDSASYSVSFYQSSRAVNGLSSIAAENTGSLLANFGVFNLGGAMPSTLLLDGLDFFYNPALGNLLMEVNVISLSQPFGYQSFFKADYTGTQTQRFYSDDGINGSAVDGALVTEFEFGKSVPTPSALTLFALGLCGLGFAARRRQKR